MHDPITLHTHSVLNIPLYNKCQFFDVRISPTTEDGEFEYFSENVLDLVITNTMKQWGSIRKIV